jgi:hypothetical protein
MGALRDGRNNHVNITASLYRIFEVGGWGTYLQFSHREDRLVAGLPGALFMSALRSCGVRQGALRGLAANDWKRRPLRRQQSAQIPIRP